MRGEDGGLGREDGGLRQTTAAVGHLVGLRLPGRSVATIGSARAARRRARRERRASRRTKASWAELAGIRAGLAVRATRR